MCHLINDAVISQHPFVSPKRTNDKRVRDGKQKWPGSEVHCHIGRCPRIVGFKPSTLSSPPHSPLSARASSIPTPPHLFFWGLRSAICDYFSDYYNIWLDYLLRETPVFLIMVQFINFR